MLSEYEQNLSKEKEWGPLIGSSSQKRNRKWSLFRQPTLHTINSEPDEFAQSTSIHSNSSQLNSDEMMSKFGFDRHPSNNKKGSGGREKSLFLNTSRKLPFRPKRTITVIDENSVGSSSQYQNIS